MFLIQQIRKINEKVKNRIPDAGVGTYLYCYLDLLFCRIIFGTHIIEYFEFEYYSKSLIEKANNFSERNRKRIVKECVRNPEKNIDLYDDKIKFNRFFDELLFRKWIDVSSSTFEEFNDFFKEQNAIMVKKVGTCQGKGIIRYDYTDKEHAKQIYEQLTAKGSLKALAEEIIIQHHEMSEYCKAVNTIRIITLTLENKAHIICCALRFGVGESDVDNMGSGGIACDVSVKEGIITSCAKNEKGDSYYYHPSSGKKIIGFQIPNWDKVIAVTKQAALMNPECGWVGWDVAVTEQGAVIVEGNCPTGVIQISAFGSYGKVKNLLRGK